MAVQGRLATIAGLTLAALLGVAAHPALAAKQWSGTKTISDPGEQVEFPNVAMNPKGLAVAVWFRDDADSRPVAMRSSVLEPGSGFGPAETIGPADPTPGAIAPALPQIAIDRSGNAIASWLMKDSDGDLRVVVAFRPAGGNFGPPETLSPPGASGYEPQIAFDRRGGAVAVWVRADDGVPRAQAATMAPGESDFGKPEWLSKSGLQGTSPRVGVTDSGRAVAVWLARGGGAQGTLFVQAAQRPKGGDFGDPQTLSDATLTSDVLQLSVGANGNAIAAWSQATPKSDDVGEVATAFSAGGDFGPAAPMPHDPDLRGFTPRVGMDSRGRATMIWLDAPSGARAGTNLMRTAVTDSAGTFGSQQLLDRTDQVSLLFPSLAVARPGNAVGTWIREDPDPQPRPLFAVVRAGAGPPFGPVQQLSPPGISAAYPNTAANRGMAIIAWNYLDGDDSRAAVNFYRSK